ncbi:MAG: LytTR family DNA-binding domain-containing protein [Saprospiraceae bacterium]|nr:LytTR family DNA-binding domain-containing protein [Saprospiraceae bacterium]
MHIRSIIVDDSAFIVEILSDMLKESHPEVEVIATADTGGSAIRAIREHQPDLVFLDVELPDMTGFEVLAGMQEIRFQVIFITAHSHYAIRAIRFNALDYLVKPINHPELAHALRRFRSRKDGMAYNDHVKVALQNLETRDADDQILFLQTQEGELRLPLRTIVRIQGERNYSLIYLARGTKKLSSKTLGYFEEILVDKGFFRCHRSYLVNGSHVTGIQVNGHFRLDDETTVPISRRKKADAKRWYQSLRSGDGG